MFKLMLIKFKKKLEKYNWKLRRRFVLSKKRTVMCKAGL